MKIAIEALGIHKFGGTRSVAINLLKELFVLDEDSEYLIFLSHPESLLQAPNVRQHLVPIENRFLARVWAQVKMPRLVRGYDLTHFMKNLGIFGLPTKSVVTVHDLTTLLYPELFPLSDVLYWKYIEKWTLRSADRVVAVSKQTAHDVESCFNVDPVRITVVENAHGRHFRPATSVEINLVRKRYKLPDNYILHVGRIDPKKNIPLLIESFADFRQNNNFPGKLIIVGEQYKKKPDLSIYRKIEQLGLQEYVHLVGIIPDEELPAFYSGSTITVFPSHHEGFGLVALEAMACDAPLIVSQAGALTEVVDDAAFVMEENTPECLTTLLNDLWCNEDKRSELRKKGLQRAKSFSWERSAQQLLQVYQEVSGKT